VTPRRALTLLLVAGALVGMQTSTAIAQDITASCDPTCSTWRTSDFGIVWTEFPAQGIPGTRIVSGCVDEPINTETKGTLLWCAVELLDTGGTVIGSAEESRLVRLDKTPPVVTGASVSREPDGNGWYRGPVGIAFNGSDSTSGIAACTSTTYAGPEGAAASATGSCTDVAGNSSAQAAFPLRYDATGPDVTSGKPVREPDHGRWYTRPVLWRFKGKDALSGLDECPTVRYAGPDGAAARAIGRCLDKAGNVSTRTFVLNYDATPPARPAVRALGRDHSVQLRVRVTPDVRSIVILRAPGRGGTRDSTIYRGRPRSFTDVHARNGTRYHYTVIARDRAAHRSRRTVSATPGPRLLAPADGAVLSAPPRLRWTPVRGADYFNVQLRRDGRKVLSRWPSGPRLELKSRWKFNGRVRRLVPGRYEWDVWPGFGDRTAARYGARIGGRSFVIPEAPPG
jgi:hypothetical protein